MKKMPMKDDPDGFMSRVFCLISGCESSYKISGAAKRLAIILAVLYVVYSRGIYFPVFGIDTYTYFNSHGYPDMLFEILHGLWGLAFLNNFFNYPLISPLVSQAIFLVITAFSILLCVMFWDRMESGRKCLWAPLVMAVFPYWAGQAYFGYFHIGYALSTFFGVLSVLVPWRKGGFWRIVCAVFCVIAGAAFYPASVVISLTLILTTMSVMLFRKIIFPKMELSAPAQVTRAILAQIIGGIGYLCLHRMALHLMGLGQINQGYSVGLDFSLTRPLAFIKIVFPGSWLLLPWQCQALFCVPLAIVLLKALFGGKMDGKGVLLKLAFFAILACSFASPLTLALVQPVPISLRNMCSLAFVWGGVFYLAFLCAGELARKLLAGCAIALCVMFAARINYAWELQALTTDADLDMAQAIWRDINDLENFPAMARPLDVAFTGCQAQDTHNWPEDMDSIFGVSQFSCMGGDHVVAQHSQAVMRFIGADIRLVRPTESDERVSRTRRPWPASESVFQNGDRVVIWLGATKRQVVNMAPRLAALKEALGITKGSELVEKTGSRLLLEVSHGRGPWKISGLIPLRGAVDAVSKPDSDGFATVVGWAYDVGPKIVPRYVALLDNMGEVAGIAATGITRPDLRQKVAIDAEYAGFSGYILSGHAIAGIAFCQDD